MSTAVRPTHIQDAFDARMRPLTDQTPLEARFSTLVRSNTSAAVALREMVKISPRAAEIVERALNEVTDFSSNDLYAVFKSSQGNAQLAMSALEQYLATPPEARKAMMDAFSRA